MPLFCECPVFWVRMLFCARKKMVGDDSSTDSAVAAAHFHAPVTIVQKKSLELNR
jgi:hypothetical protein